jgi:AAA-like domain
MINDGYRYQVGGSLATNAPSYIIRQADSELYQALFEGKFCYVFNSRQMGKSSLRVKAKNALQEAGFACASIDMTSIIRHNITPAQWYKGIATQIWRGFNLIDQVNLKTWWQEQNDLAPLQCLSLFIEEIVLTYVLEEKIFIFIDEIDSVLSLNFAVDDFFALIRQCYNRRAETAAYNRLGFALFGVTTPSDLINDCTRTPFNIGTSIELKGLQVSEAAFLSRGLEAKFNNPQAVLQAIIYWTEGQPFLTQKLCQIAVSKSELEMDWVTTGNETKWIEKLVFRYIIKDWETQDEPEHLKTICDRLLRDEKRAGYLLNKYQQILLQDSIPSNDSVEQIELLSSGLVVKRAAKLQVHNPIYRAVFNQAWIEKQLDRLRPYAKQLNAWQHSLGQDRDAQSWAGHRSLNISC